MMVEFSPTINRESQVNSNPRFITTLVGNDAMGDEKTRRIDDALSSLVELLIPAAQAGDEARDEERHSHGVELANNIIEGYKKSTTVSDVNQASSLIKNKLLRENDSTDKAVQFTNLYARLLTQPVLSQKWAILYLLHQLSDPHSAEEGSSKSKTSQAERGQLSASQKDSRAPEIQEHDGNMPTFNEALSSAELNRLHVHGIPSEEGARSNQEATKLNGDKAEEIPETSNHLLLKEKNSRNLIPTEAMFLRDLPFTLQGLSTAHLAFASTTTLTLPSTLPLPLISLLHTLAEPSLLYRNLSDFVESRDKGLMGQSLRSTIGYELRTYLSLIATLEGEIRRALASLDLNEPDAKPGKVGITLKRCVVWTREATMGLRLMSVMVEQAKSRKGGQLISIIHALSSSHGDPFVGAFAERMLVHVTKPFYDMLRQWIYDGELSDPYNEFFVIEQDSHIKGVGEVDTRRAPATSVWEDKYKLEDTMIPSIMSEELARKVFLIGKSLNFIRYGCGDSAWVEAYCKDASKELRYGDTATLESSIDKAYTATMARLIHLMDSKFQLFEHLRALKKYLLLGQGDFIALLMESLSSNLDRPAGSQYRHTLTAQLEHAIRGSNAQYDSPEVLRRLDARLLELSHGDIGWDVFALEYKVDAPVDVIITPWASRKYLTVFNFLWRVKRVEFALGSTWRRCMTGARGVLANVEGKMSRDWKVARCCIAEMIHFVNQLQYYILFEVIEASWDQLQAAITKPDCTLDDLIGAHTIYLESITHKGLLGPPRHATTGTREDSFTSQLHHLLKIMLAYKEAVDGLYSFSVAEFTRRQELSAKFETRLPNPEDDDRARSSSPFSAPKPNILTGSASNNNNNTNTDDQMLPALRVRLGELERDFRARVNILLGDLANQPDVDMRFLGVVMNFNGVYAPRRRRREGKEERRRTPGAGSSAGGGGSTVGGAGSFVTGDGATGGSSVAEAAGSAVGSGISARRQEKENKDKDKR